MERVFYNGTIYTMDEGLPLARAIVTEGDRIIFTGGIEEALSMAGEGAERIDLGGLCVVPGLTDAHAHFTGYAAQRHRIDLTGTRSIDEVRSRIA